MTLTLGLGDLNMRSWQQQRGGGGWVGDFNCQGGLLLGGARGGEETQGELLQKSHRHVLDFPNIEYQLLSWTQGL